MGYPVSYRGAGAFKGGPRSLPAPSLPPLEFGPLAGAAMAAWAFGELLQQVDWGQFWPPGTMITTQSPGGYGWTVDWDCGAPPARLPAASWTSCGLKVVSKNNWEGQHQNPLTASTLWWWAAGGRYNAALFRYEQCQTAQRWVKGAGLPFSRTTIAPAFPRPMPPAVLALAPPAIATRAYDPPDKDSSWWWGVISPPFDPGVVGGVDVVPPEGAVRYFRARAVARPRAVAPAGTREVKVPQNSTTGRAFMAMYRAFNFLGDAYGFTRALWGAIPASYRGGSRSLGNMARDLWDYFGHLQTASRDERLDYFMSAATRGAMWKAQDAAYGGLQSGIFSAQAQRYGYNAARAWSTVDSAVNMSANSLQRASYREQNSTRL